MTQTQMEEDYYEDEQDDFDVEEEDEYICEEEPVEIPKKKLRYNAPVFVPNSSNVASSLDSELVDLVDVFKPRTNVSNQAISTKASGQEAQQLLKQALGLFDQVRNSNNPKSTEAFPIHLKALTLLVKCIDKHQQNDGPMLERTLKRALYQGCELSRTNEQYSLDLSALLRDKCMKKVDDGKYLLTMLSLRVGAVSGLKMLLKSYPKTELIQKAAGRVSAQYYKGREALLLNQPNEALYYFIQAFQEIPRDAKPQTLRNKRRIFLRILPLRLVCEGKTPSTSLLQRFSMQSTWDAVYAPMIALAKQGDERSVLQHIELYRIYLLQLDCLGFVRNAMVAVARQHVIRIAFERLGKQMDLHLLASLSCFDGDLDRLTYILADLFSRGLLAGYMTLQSFVLPNGEKPFKTLGTAKPKLYRQGLI